MPVCVCVFVCLFLPHGVAYGILVPWLGMERGPPAVEAQSLNHWATCEIPHDFYFILSCHLHHQVTVLSVIASK